MPGATELQFFLERRSDVLNSPLVTLVPLNSNATSLFLPWHSLENALTDFEMPNRLVVVIVELRPEGRYSPSRVR